VTENLDVCDGFVTAETLNSDECDGCDAFFEVNEENENSSASEADLEPVTTHHNPSHEPVTPVTTHHNPSQPSHEIDYSTFPHLTSDTVEAKRNQAQTIRQRLLAATSREELTAIKKEFGSRCRWVWRKLLTDAERAKVEAIASTEQLNLLDTTGTSQSSSG
jgi:putative DNA primase/helicase